MTACVKCPPILVGEFFLPEIRTLLRQHKTEILLGIQCRSMPLLVDVCNNIVSSSYVSILEHIHPILDKWYARAPEIYQYIVPERCFFGIDENDILANVKNVLPKCFIEASRSTDRSCDSLQEFGRLIAKEVTARINYRVALKMNSSMSHLKRSYDCNCISYETLHAMIDQLAKTLCCILHNNCNCCAVPRKPGDISTAMLHQILVNTPRVFATAGMCGITYCCPNTEVIRILTAIHEADRHSDKSEEGWWEALDSNDTQDSSWTSDDIHTDSDNAGDRSGPDYIQMVLEEQMHAESNQPSDSHRVCAQSVGRDSTPEGPSNTFSTDRTGPTYTTKEVTKETKYATAMITLTALLARVVKKSRTLVTEDLVTALRELQREVVKGIDIEQIQVTSDSSVVRTMYNSLLEQYSCPEAVLKALTPQDSPVESAIINSLRTHLTKPAEPEKNAFTRFFSCLCNKIRKPFKCRVSPQFLLCLSSQSIQ